MSYELKISVDDLPGQPFKIEEWNLMGKRLLAIRDLKEQLKEALTNTNKMLEAYEQFMCAHMVRSEMYDFKTPDAKFSASAKAYVSVPEKNWATFVAWAEQQKESLFEDKHMLNDKMLNELCDKLLEAGQPLPPGVVSFIKATVRVRKP